MSACARASKCAHELAFAQRLWAGDAWRSFKSDDWLCRSSGTPLAGNSPWGAVCYDLSAGKTTLYSFVCSRLQELCATATQKKDTAEVAESGSSIRLISASIHCLSIRKPDWCPARTRACARAVCGGGGEDKTSDASSATSLAAMLAFKAWD